MGGPSAPKILYPKWQNEYQVALLELDRKKLLERVTAAETAKRSPIDECQCVQAIVFLDVPDFYSISTTGRGSTTQTVNN